MNKWMGITVVAVAGAAAGFIGGRALPRAAAPAAPAAAMERATPGDSGAGRTEGEVRRPENAPARAPQPSAPGPSANFPPAGFSPQPVPPDAAAADAAAPPDLARAERETARLQVEHEDALIREARRIDERMQATTDANELAILTKLDKKIAALDEAQSSMLQAATPAEKEALTKDVQRLIGEVMQLNQADRQYRMTELAQSLGLEDPAAATRLMQETETIFRETQRDLAPVFSRGGPFQPSVPEPFRTEPPPETHPVP